KSDAAGKRVIEAFSQAKEGQLDGIRQALCLALNHALFAQLRKMLPSLPARVAAAAIEVLGFERPPEMAQEQWDKFLKHDDTAVPLAGWRAARLDIPQSVATYHAAFQDESPAVRREAMLAAAWGRQPWLLEHCRKVASRLSSENMDTILLLAILGK